MVGRLVGSILSAVGSDSSAPGRSSRSTQTESDPLTRETERLALDVVLFTLGRRKDDGGADETSRCLRHSVQKMLSKHALVFNGMVTRLDVTAPGTDFQKGFQEMSDELFGVNEV